MPHIFFVSGDSPCCTPAVERTNAMTLEERAAEQFEIHDSLRVLFFFDPEEKHREDVETWSHDRIRCVEARQFLFRLKVRLEDELADTPVFLYVPASRPDDWSGNPLADLWFANRELRIDRVAEFMEEHGLGAEHRGIVQHYYDGELEYKNRREFLGGILSSSGFSEERLRLGLVAYHAKETFEDVCFRSVPQRRLLHAALLVGAANEASDEATDPDAFDDFDDFQARCEDLELTDLLRRLVSRQFELDAPELDVETMREAARVMKYNLLLPEGQDPDPDDPYRRLYRASNLVRQEIWGLYQAWQDHGALKLLPQETLDALTPNFDETRLVDVYGAGADFGYLTPTLRRLRLQKAVDHLRERPSRSKRILDDLGRPGQSDDPAVTALRKMATFYQILAGYGSLDLGTPEEFVRQYREELSRCDTCYRHAVRAVHTLRREQPEQDELLREAFDRFLSDYHHEYLHPLNTAWQRALEESVQGGEKLQLRSANRQGRFFADHLAKEEQKTAVIISDGLRYEAAQELARRLSEDARKQVDLDPALAALPSVTSVGMSHLLPHESIASRGDGSFEIDETSTRGTANRERILQSSAPDAKAVSFDDVVRMGQSEGRELFKSHPLVYIYHDRIDATGDNRKTETDVVSAVEETIAEVRQLVRTLNNWNVYRVLVTADHGFLYSDEKIPPSMQEQFPEVEGEVLRKNRVLLAKADRKTTDSTGYRFPVRTASDIDADLDVIVPRAVNRYRQSGAGKQYAHGGASLQEVVVPTMEVRKKREDTAEKVGVRLLSDERTIRSGNISIELLQTEAISSGTRPRTVEVGLYDDEGQLVSNEEALVLNAQASTPTDRTQKVVLALTPEADDLNLCNLRIHDEDDTGRLDPLIDQRYSINRLIERDF